MKPVLTRVYCQDWAGAGRRVWPAPVRKGRCRRADPVPFGTITCREDPGFSRKNPFGRSILPCVSTGTELLPSGLH